MTTIPVDVFVATPFAALIAAARSRGDGGCAGPIWSLPPRSLTGDTIGSRRPPDRTIRHDAQSTGR